MVLEKQTNKLLFRVYFQVFPRHSQTKLLINAAAIQENRGNVVGGGGGGVGRKTEINICFNS